MSSIDMGGERSAEGPVIGTADVRPEADDGSERPGGGLPESVGGPTSASTWYAASGGPITDRLLEWPPDEFALTNVVLGRSEAFRFALSGQDWPPSRFPDWCRAVAEAGRRWSAWAEDRTGAMPDLVRRVLLSMLEERATRQSIRANRRR